MMQLLCFSLFFFVIFVEYYTSALFAVYVTRNWLCKPPSTDCHRRRNRCMLRKWVSCILALYFQSRCYCVIISSNYDQPVSPQ